MERIKPVFTTYQFDVEVVTPVHVGMAQEKNFLRGLDYVLTPNGRDAVLTFLNQQLVLQELSSRSEDLIDYSTKLALGKVADIENFLLKKKLTDQKFVAKRIAVQGQPDEIKRTYQTAMGQYIIPGSSIKGAIRSIIYAQLKGQLGSQATEEEMFGKITNNLMRYFHTSDIAMQPKNVKIYATKTFSGDGDPKRDNSYGSWKHHGGKGGHREDFSEQGFSFFYEALMTQSKSALQIRMPTHLPEQLRKNALQDTINYNLFDKHDAFWLTRLIKAHTEKYLLKELAYYKRFKNDALDELTSIEDRINDLIRRNKQENACLMRVGAGVGFHSITGDWTLDSRDHFTAWNNKDYAIRNKTRKFAFTYSEKHQNYIFYPMGFIKLSLTD